MASARELRALDEAKLRELYEDKKQDLYTMRINHAQGELKDTSTLRQARREVARILMVLQEREAAAESAAKGK
jgi:large subunit ribosomal protein L29